MQQLVAAGRYAFNRHLRYHAVRMRNDSDCLLDKSTSQFNVYADSAASQHDAIAQSDAYSICLCFYNTQGSGQAGFLTWVRVYTPTFKIHGELVLFKSGFRYPSTSVHF